MSPRLSAPTFRSGLDRATPSSVIPDKRGKAASLIRDDTREGRPS